MEHQNKLIYGGLLAISALTGCTEPVTEKPLNIVYIMTDDHTAQMMSCYDKRYMDTPNLDRIANEGVRFTNSFVANSLSGPSRACMLTGKHSCENQIELREFKNRQRQTAGCSVESVTAPDPEHRMGRY